MQFQPLIFLVPSILPNLIFDRVFGKTDWKNMPRKCSQHIFPTCFSPNPPRNLEELLELQISVVGIAYSGCT
jgi:hypothetical protein